MPLQSAVTSTVVSHFESAVADTLVSERTGEQSPSRSAVVVSSVSSHFSVGGIPANLPLQGAVGHSEPHARAHSQQYTHTYSPSTWELPTYTGRGRSTASIPTSAVSTLCVTTQPCHTTTFTSGFDTYRSQRAPDYGHTSSTYTPAFQPMAMAQEWGRTVPSPSGQYYPTMGHSPVLPGTQWRSPVNPAVSWPSPWRQGPLPPVMAGQQGPVHYEQPVFSDPHSLSVPAPPPPLSASHQSDVEGASGDEEEEEDIASSSRAFAEAVQLVYQSVPPTECPVSAPDPSNEDELTASFHILTSKPNTAKSNRKLPFAPCVDKIVDTIQSELTGAIPFRGGPRRKPRYHPQGMYINQYPLVTRPAGSSTYDLVPGKFAQAFPLLDEEAKPMMNPSALKSYSVRAEDFHKLDASARLSARVANSTFLLLSALTRELGNFENVATSSDELSGPWQNICTLIGQAARSVTVQAEVACRASAAIVLMRRDHVLTNLPLEKDAVRHARLLPWSGPLLFGGQFQEVLRKNEELQKHKLAFEQLAVAKQQQARAPVIFPARKTTSVKKPYSRRRGQYRSRKSNTSKSAGGQQRK